MNIHTYVLSTLLQTVYVLWVHMHDFKFFYDQNILAIGSVSSREETFIHHSANCIDTINNICSQQLRLNNIYP